MPVAPAEPAENPGGGTQGGRRVRIAGRGARPLREAGRGRGYACITACQEVLPEPRVPLERHRYVPDPAAGDRGRVHSWRNLRR
ncbi:Hypothetical protein CAP_7094 [Chondromyces apiculatus DSM 436]|uniref:Uncharacterized protein n=1 Tax=Chondromyces apiculatus DSM 436 TaxID=1192034 RepID=A0A017T0E8_9BACT|nr:Hypothetical protein CAP_7094 [Chondromyces apiculatus DSM 436]